MVHFEVPRDHADALATSLRGLESAGLQLVIARSDGATAPAGLRGVELDLIGEDRLGIVSQLTRILAEAGVSIEHIHTEIVGGGDGGQEDLQGRGAPARAEVALDPTTLRRKLEVVAHEMMVDIALGDRPD